MSENREYVSRSDELGNIHISEEVLAAIAAAAALVGLVYLLVRRNKYDENTLSISAVAAAAK